MVACEASNYLVSDHFPHVRKTIGMTKGVIKEIIDYCLSKYAYYLIVQNANPNKKSVAWGQIYFAIQPRKQKISY